MVSLKLSEKIICLDLNSSTSYKQKKSLIEVLTSNGVKVSFVLNKNVSLLVKNDRTTVDTYKCRTAFKLGIPVIHVDFIYKCLIDEVVELKDFLILNLENVNSFKQGKIVKNLNQKQERKINLDLSKIKTYNSKSIDSPVFDESNMKIAKWFVFNKLADQSSTIFELQVSNLMYRLRIQRIKNKNIMNSEESDIDYVFADSSFILFELFKHFANNYLNEKQYTYTLELPNLSAGSKLLKQISWKSMISNIKELDSPVSEFVEFIWNEAIGDLENLFNIDFKSFKDLFTIEQIDKAECVLRKQRDEIEKDFSDEFYVILPFKNENVAPIKDKQILTQRFEICQVLRDIINISEATDWNLRASTSAKYRSIGSFIKPLDKNSEEYLNIKNYIFNSKNDELTNRRIRLINVYGVLRPNDSVKFNDGLSNTRLLFHGSKCRNIVGILSRGLLLPNHVVNEFGLTRSDIGMLGNGIYFSDCINTSLKYSDLSKLRNSRVLTVCEVALGKCKDYHEFNFGLVKAPENFSSTHGVKKTQNVDSKFLDDEYVIYDSSQQKIRYIIELQYEDDGNVKDFHRASAQEIEDEAVGEQIIVETNEIDKLEKGKNILDKPECGLVSSSGTSIPLKSIHLRVQLLDMVSKVVIFQEYENEEDYAIEAKFLFPLEDNAAVCGFEAFVNDKHVIGVCKEKEVAHKEYKEAIEKGHGAYLMDQETAELFKVNIGNLPSNCKCIIKITYVAELSIENENIVFRLPNSIAPWEAFKFTNEKLQDSLITKCFDSIFVPKNKITLELSIQMPFDIRSIYSPTHTIDIKKTMCQAVVRLNKEQSLTETFLLFVSMSAIHVPRMLVEENSSFEDSRACMLSFYPEFESNKLECPFIIFLMDSSNSMSNSFRFSKKLLGLMIRKLPEKCLFNIISFGSSYEELFPFAFKNDKNNLVKANDFINKQEPKNGNTNLLQAIQPYLLISQNELVNFVLISDGHINESESLFSVLNKTSTLRFFTCAVGSNPNKHLLKMLSYHSNGSFEQFDSKVQSKWNEKVEEIIDKLSQPPAIGNIRVDWETHNKVDKIDLQAPLKINSLFNGRRQVIYGFVPNCLLATLKADLDGQEVSTVVSCPDLMITKGSIIHKLAAKAMIDDWQYGILSSDSLSNDIMRSKLKENIIKMSKEYSITSEYTSFIAVEERDEREKKIKYGKNDSTTPKIEKLIENDSDAMSIDILSYMEFESKKDDKLENLNDIINRFYSNFEMMSDQEVNELSLVMAENQKEVHEQMSSTHPTRLKFDHLLMKTYYRRGLFDLAAKIGKESFDGAITEFDCLSEDSYEDCTLIMQLLREDLMIASEIVESRKDDFLEMAILKNRASLRSEGLFDPDSESSDTDSDKSNGENCLSDVFLNTEYFCAAKDDLFENLLQNKKAESQVELTRRSRGGVRTKHTARKSTGGKAPRKTNEEEDEELCLNIVSLKPSIINDVAKTSSLSRDESRRQSSLFDSLSYNNRIMPTMNTCMSNKLDDLKEDNELKRLIHAKSKIVISKQAPRMSRVEKAPHKIRYNNQSNEDIYALSRPATSRRFLNIDQARSKGSFDQNNNSNIQWMNRLINMNNNNSSCEMNNAGLLESQEEFNGRSGSGFQSLKRLSQANSQIQISKEATRTPTVEKTSHENILSTHCNMERKILFNQNSIDYSCDTNCINMNNYNNMILNNYFNEPSQSFAMDLSNFRDNDIDEYCEFTSGHQDLLLLDVIPLSIGIKISGGLVKQIIKRNTTISTRTSHRFTQDEINFSNDNRFMIIEIYEGERVMARDNHFLDKIELKCSDSREITQEIEVNCDIDANGILTVIAIDLSNGNKNKIKITNDRGRLSSDEINKMVNDYEKNKESDERERDRVLEEQSRKSHENDNIFSIWKRLGSFLVSKIINCQEELKLKTCLTDFLEVKDTNMFIESIDSLNALNPNFTRLLNELDKCGVNSLGTKASFEIKMMILNLIFYSIFILKHRYVVQKKENKEVFGVKSLRKLIEERKSQFLFATTTEEVDQIYKAIDFIEIIQSKYSLACSLLEFSRNWDLFVKNWFDNSNFIFLFDYVPRNESCEYNHDTVTIDEID